MIKTINQLMTALGRLPVGLSRHASAAVHEADAQAAQVWAPDRLLFESNPLPMWVHDWRSLAFLDVNAAAICRYGWSREAFLSRTLLDLRPDEQWPHIRAFVAGLDHEVAVRTGEHLTATGARLLEKVANRRIDYRGTQAVLAVVSDMADIEQARGELKQKNAALAEITQVLTARTGELEDAARLAGIGTWNLSLYPTRRVQWSPEIYAIFDRDPAQFPLNIEEIIACVHPEDRLRFRSTYAAMIRDGGDEAMEFRVVRPSGEIRVLRERARARRDAAGEITAIAGVIQDITQQKIAADALLRAEKLKTIGQITGGIAHDFNNLLTVIALNLEIALDQPDIGEDLRTLLEPARHATMRGTELTAQMLAYSRRQALKPVVVELQSLVHTLQPLLERAVGQRHTLRVTAPATGLRIEIDPGQLENALMNLAINARDALTDKEHAGRGHIEIRADEIHLAADLCGMPDRVPAGDYVRLRVADTGSGIPAALLPRILEPFFTTKPVGSGSGLGLSMVYGFVQQSQGCMTVSSSPGQGTTIDLFFPVVRMPAG